MKISSEKLSFHTNDYESNKFIITTDKSTEEINIAIILT